MLRNTIIGKNELDKGCRYEKIETTNLAYLYRVSSKGQHHYIVFDNNNQTTLPKNKTEWAEVNRHKFRTLDRAKEEYSNRNQLSIAP